LKFFSIIANVTENIYKIILSFRIVRKKESQFQKILMRQRYLVYDNVIVFSSFKVLNPMCPILIIASRAQDYACATQGGYEKR